MTSFTRRLIRRFAAQALVVSLIGLVGVLVNGTGAQATDLTCADFGFVESYKVDNLNEPTYPWPDGYTVAIAKAGSENQDLGHEVVLRSENDPISHSSDKDLSHVHFCETPFEPALSVVKTGDAKARPGDSITYTFEVTNEGDVPLVNVSVDDDVLGHIGDIALLAVESSEILEFQTVAPADDVTNTATACGIDPLEEEVCDTDDHTLDVIHPALTVVKTGAEHALEGDEVLYSFEVTNTGDVVLTNVGVDDDVLGHIGEIPSLGISHSETLTTSVPAPASDVRNVATACGDDGLEGEVCDDDDHTVDITHPGLDVEKSGAEFAHEGDEITYTFTVHNTGDVELTNISVDDDILGAIGTIPSLASGATSELTKTMTVPQGASAVDNEVTVCGIQPQELGELCDSDIHHLTVIHPALSVDKLVGGADHKPSSNALGAHPGDQLGYTVLISNIGDTPLEISALSDSLNEDLAGSCAQGVGSVLAPASAFPCTYTSEAAADENNVVSAAGIDSLGGEGGTVEASDETFVRVIDPAIEIVKTADPVSVEPGQTTTYSYEVTNTGDTQLTDVSVTDDVLGRIGTIESLAPGSESALTKTVTIQADSPRTNIGTACGIDELGLQVCDTDAETIAIVLPAGPEGRTPAGSLPATGFRVLLWMACATALVAAGLAMTQIRRDSRRA